MYVELSLIQALLAVVSGVLVGFSLGLIGGGGSILAIPLLLYFVGLAYEAPPHSAAESYIDHLVIGTTALSVGLNAYLNSFMHYRKGNVSLRNGVAFSLPGAAGAVTGAYVGHLVGGGLLLFMFSFVMIGIALTMLKSKSAGVRELEERVTAGPKVTTSRLVRVIPAGFAVGVLSGVFGIGGGFLIVPALMYSAGLTMIRAIGTSLMAVGTFGVTSAATYALFGELSLEVAFLYLMGGLVGGYVGTRLASGLPNVTLKRLFALVVIAVAFYIMYQNFYAISALL
ncbi:anion permease [Sulfodiicoccus acidiphilus]|nr:sulfite exporter TauE/SafE family protein [Sulfodiicoccus acidiphilus]BBD72255.1 anion permease [Sulfodiicoccus acidiphilus]